MRGADKNLGKSLSRKKRSECPKTLDLQEAWLQIGCIKVLSIYYQNDKHV